ncbi:hypothetical protein, partial [Bacillus pumilus]|uniref:hypothetical protein n=1 Tax=Bacillus pumilus TaxID=1408 RepID=UPI003F68B866
MTPLTTDILTHHPPLLLQHLPHNYHQPDFIRFPIHNQNPPFFITKQHPLQSHPGKEALHHQTKKKSIFHSKTPLVPL